MPSPAVTVIVPVMRRPQNAQPFMASLESTEGAQVLAVADEDDNETWRAWLQVMPKGAGRVVRSAWPAPGGTFAQKVNLGFRMLPWSTKWLFIVGDDVRFHEGWLETAIIQAGIANAQVVGTCAQGASEDWSPHLLISRQYVIDRGASWDGPGLVCHEGYRHNYVDVELCTVARQRQTWAMSWNSVVEHMHPFFGKGFDDVVYRLGQASVDADAAVWRERRERFAEVAA